MPPGHDDAGERILDLALYAPLGLVMSALEAMPDLVRKGRERLGPQVGMARTVGQFAVHQGYRQVAGLARSRGPFPFRPGQPAAETYAVYTTEPPGGDDSDRDGDGDGDGDEGMGMVTAPIKPSPRRPCRPVRPHPWEREPPTSVPSNWPYPVTTRCQPRKWSNV